MIASAHCGRILRLSAGSLFAGLLVFAPLNFGSTRAGGPEIIALGCAAATLLWAASLVLSGRRPRIPRLVAFAVFFFVIAAIPWITGLAHATPVSPFTQSHFSRVAARWPVSIVWRTPANTLALTLALAVSLLPLIDLARSRGWAVTFSLALVVAAVAVGLLALLQNYTGATGIYWRNDGRMPGNFCGTFYHHTTAGAYFNTAWPLAVALAWLAWNRVHTAPFGHTLLIAAGLATIVLLAAHGSHVSRFPQFAALLIAPFLLIGLKIKIRGRRRWLLSAGGVAAVLLLVVVAGRASVIRERWQLLFAVTPVEHTHVRPADESAWPALVRDDLFIPHTSQSGWLGDRGEAWRTALRSIGDRPFTGHGPANWMGAASHHTEDPFVRTFFQFLQFTHQDVLQFAVEWGVPAALGWWALFVGAIVTVIRAHRRFDPLHRALGIAAACALAAVLLQAQIDFPFEMPAVAFNAIVLAALCWAGTGHQPEALVAA